MTNRSTGPACGNNPNHRMSDGDRQAVADFRAYLAARAALARIRQMADAWEQQLPEVIRTPAVVSALRAVLDDAAPAVVPPPADQTGEVRDQLLHAIDFNYVASLGYSGPEELLAAYDTSRTPAADRAALHRIAEAALAAVETALGDTLAADAREEALAGIAAVLPEPTDRAASDLEIARTTNQRLNREKQRLESELAAYRRAVSQWEISERGTYIPHASLRAIGLASGKDILGSVRHLKHFERVEQAEAEVERLRAGRAASLQEAAALLHQRASSIDALSSSDFGEEARAVGELAEAAETATTLTQPHRGDAFEQWLKAQRDEWAPEGCQPWQILDQALEEYRLHADTGTPLSEHVCEARVVGDCECLEQPAAGARQDGATP